MICMVQWKVNLQADLPGVVMDFMNMTQPMDLKVICPPKKSLICFLAEVSQVNQSMLDVDVIQLIFKGITILITTRNIIQSERYKIPFLKKSEARRAELRLLSKDASEASIRGPI